MSAVDDDKTCSSSASDPIDEAAYYYHRHVAAEMNNVGVQLAESSEHRAAAEMFGDAIRTAKRAHALLEGESESTEDCGDDMAASYEGRARAHASLASLQKTRRHAGAASASSAATTRTTKKRLYSSKSGLMIYSNPLRLDASLSRIQKESAEERSSSGKKDLSVILFNIALVHHLRGCERGAGAPQSLRKALTSYNIAHSVFSAANQDTPSVPDDRADLLRSAQLSMGVLNNIGTIVLELQPESEVSTQYFDGLSRLLTDYGKNVAWEGFELNVLRTSSCPSPAA